MNIVRLDHDRELRFTYSAICALEGVCNINIYEGNPFEGLSPSRIRALVWAAQLHTEKPLKLDEVGTYLPLDPEELVKVVEAISGALSDAFKKKE